MNDFLVPEAHEPPQAQAAPPLANQPMDPPLQEEVLMGPVELNLLERVEYGLAFSDRESETRQEASHDNDHKFEGQREVIFVSGWANISQIFAQQRLLFAGKVVVGLAAIAAFNFCDQNMWPVALALLVVNFAGTVAAAFSLYSYWNADRSIKAPIWIELNEGLSLQVYFLGYLLHFLGWLPAKPLPLFAVPGLLFSGLVFLYYSDEHSGVSTRKFMIVEWVQLGLIALKVSGVLLATWNYTLFLYMAGAIYITVLGVFLTMILACSVVGIFQRRVEGWKVRALLWTTWNYLSAGLFYIYLVKIVIHFYNDDGISGKDPVVAFREFTNEEVSPMVTNAMALMVGLSLVSLVSMLFLRRDIIRFLTRVVYRNEVRKEVSLRTLSKSFTFKLIQASATYFLRPEAHSQTAAATSQCEKAQEEDAKGAGQALAEPDTCFLCCDASPNVMLDPCGHGGVCKECVINFLKNQGERCPFCKRKIGRVYVLDRDEEDGRYFTKGEIQLNK